jgi:hypothetical protein
MNTIELILANATVLIIGFAFILGLLEILTRTKKFHITYEEARKKYTDLSKEASEEMKKGNNRNYTILKSKSQVYKEIMNSIQTKKIN